MSSMSLVSPRDAIRDGFGGTANEAGLRDQYPWLQGPLLDRFLDFWADDPATALSRLRQTGEYSRAFAGIRREDGTLRMDENEYFSTRISVQEFADEFGLQVTRDQFASMLEAEVGIQEFAQVAQDAFQRFVEPGSDDRALAQAYINAFASSGSAVEALEQVREGSAYRQRFAGNVRDDGTVRMSEQEYFAYERGYNRIFLRRGLNPEVFRDRGRLAEAVEAELSINELEGRVQAVEQGVLANTSETLDWFTDNYGEAGAAFLTENGSEAVALAMAIDPEIGGDLLQRRISAAQIGGEATIQGLSRSVERAERLASAGVTQGGAREFYGMASQNLGGISATTRRFGRGATSLSNLEDAFLVGAGSEQQRIERSLRAEQSSFSSAQDVMRDQQGGLSGLRRR